MSPSQGLYFVLDWLLNWNLFITFSLFPFSLYPSIKVRSLSDEMKILF